MMGPVGQMGGDVMRRDMDTERPMGPGKKMQAVGQMAKAAVRDAREAGIELPKNAQGMAASGVARGADPASLFASLVVPEDPEVPDVPDVPVVPEDPAVGDDMMFAQKAMAVPVQDAPVQMTSAEAVLSMRLAATQTP